MFCEKKLTKVMPGGVVDISETGSPLAPKSATGFVIPYSWRVC